MSDGVLRFTLPLVFTFALSPPLTMSAEARQDDARGVIVGCLNAFKDPDWQKRELAFRQFMAMSGERLGETWTSSAVLTAAFKRFPDLEETIRLALIRLLETENKKVRAAAVASLSEDYTSYWGDLIAAVSGLRDRRALEVLADDLDTGGSAISGVAQFGPAALDLILHRAGATDPTLRAGATAVLAAMVLAAPATVTDAESRARVRMALIRATSDQEPGVRLGAIRGLAAFPDAEVTRVLQRLADSDPFFSQAGRAGQPTVYPLREAARNVLRQRSGRD